MGKFIFGVLILIVAGGAGVAYSEGFIKFNAGVNAGSCEADGEIPAATRDALDSRASAFTQAILNQKAADALAMMTDEVRAALPLEKFEPGVDAMVGSAAPFENPHISHTYFLQNTGGGPETRTVCGTLADNKWVSVEIKPGSNQGYVVVSSKTRNNDWAFTFWLLPKGNDWQVQYFHMNTSTIAGLTPEDLLQRARKERDSGHMFNAAMLYAGVQGTTDFGLAYQLGIVQSLREDLGKFQTPPELIGKPPFIWTMGAHKYTVQQVSIIGIAGQIGLMFMLPQAEWNGEAEADKFNREFINAFIATHSDYSRSFSFLVARALKPDNSGGFGTVYQNGKGFD